MSKAETLKTKNQNLETLAQTFIWEEAEYKDRSLI